MLPTLLSLQLLTLRFLRVSYSNRCLALLRAIAPPEQAGEPRYLWISGIKRVSFPVVRDILEIRNTEICCGPAKETRETTQIGHRPHSKLLQSLEFIYA